MYEISCGVKYICLHIGILKTAIANSFSVILITTLVTIDLNRFKRFEVLKIQCTHVGNIEGLNSS